MQDNEPFLLSLWNAAKDGCGGAERREQIFPHHVFDKVSFNRGSH